MSASGVSGYAALHARVRAMYSSLLTQEQLAGLAGASDFSSLIAGLKHTGYGPYLDRLKDKEITPAQATLQFKSRLSDAYNSVIQMAPGGTRPLLIQLFRAFEVGNLKAVLRGILTGAAWERVNAVLFPLGARSQFSPQVMVETGSIGAAVEQLRATPYYDALSFAMKRFSAEGSLFPLEVALDLAYWRKLWQEALQLSGKDREQAVRVIGALVDTNNLMWAIRYREYHHLSEEELINYTLPFGHRVRDEHIRGIAAGADIASVVKRLFPGLPGVGELLEEPRTGLPRLELELKKYVLERCKAAFVGDPFHIGIALAYLIMYDLEIQDLTLLLEAKSSQLPDQDFRPYLVKPLPA